MTGAVFWRGRPPRAASGERGAAAVETVLMVPAVLLVVALFVFGYRLWSARAAVLSAAESGARAATLSKGAVAGRQAAESAAGGNLTTLGIRCASQRVTADTAALARPAGVSGVVAVTVTCVVSMGDLAVPGAPGSITITRAASEVVNTFEERNP